MPSRDMREARSEYAHPGLMCWRPPPKYDEWQRNARQSAAPSPRAHSGACSITSLALAARSRLIQPTKKGGRQNNLPPPIFEKIAYFRLVIAVRSAESLAMPAAPHQLEPTPVGLIAVMLLVPEPLKALVKALQSPFDRLVSE